ncbi:hypothetical protein DRQ07_00415 [candidate division KSB1 bacterium]|nr:MAG: hypothetical protein DRQ07_00415 [candidate division KSB1 bacterium]
MFRRQIIPVVLLLSVLAIFNGCSKKSPAVAYIGSKEVIRLDEFNRDFLRSKSLQDAENASLEEKKNFLNRLIDNRLLIIGAQEAGMDQDSVVKSRVDGFIKGKMIQKLYDIEVADKVIKERDIRDLYARLSKEATVRMIFVKRPSDNSVEKIEEAKDKINKALQRVRNGEDFAQVAREMSDDPSSRERGGLIKSMTWVRKDDPIRKAVFSLQEGQISNVLDERQGYFIFKLEKLKRIKQEPYKNARKQLRQRLISANRSKLSSVAKKYLRDAKAFYMTAWIDSSLRKFSEAVAPYAKSNRAAMVDSMERLPKDIKNMILVKCVDQDFTVQDFINRVKITPLRKELVISRPEGIQLAIDGWLTQDALVYQAKKKKLHKDPEILKSAEQQKRSEMSKRFLGEVIYKDLSVSDKEIMDFYNKHKEDKYFTPEKAKVQEIMLTDKDLADKIAKRAKRGENFTRLVKKYSERKRYKEKNGIIDYFPKGSWGAIGAEAFKLKKGEISGPIKLGNRYSIIKLLDKKKREIKPLKEVYDRVRRDVQNEKRRDLKERWLSNKRSELGVKINEPVLAVAFK